MFRYGPGRIKDETGLVRVDADPHLAKGSLHGELPFGKSRLDIIDIDHQPRRAGQGEVAVFADLAVGGQGGTVLVNLGIFDQGGGRPVGC